VEKLQGVMIVMFLFGLMMLKTGFFTTAQVNGCRNIGSSGCSLV